LAEGHGFGEDCLPINWNISCGGKIWASFSNEAGSRLSSIEYAEGQARHGRREFLQFLSHASGSLAELETQLLLAENFGYYDHDRAAGIAKNIEELQRMIAAIRRKLSFSSH